MLGSKGFAMPVTNYLSIHGQILHENRESWQRGFECGEFVVPDLPLVRQVVFPPEYQLFASYIDPDQFTGYFRPRIES